MKATAPLDPATPRGKAAEDRLNDVLAGVMARIQREASVVAPAKPSKKGAA
jgi:hypothetical protein